MKVYFYEGARDPTVHDKSGYVDCVPFSEQGIARHVEVVNDPHVADLICAGQFHDTYSWKLQPERFCWFEQYPEKHVFDVEGDWRGKEIPAWLRPAILTAMNAWPQHLNWDIMVRPGSSKLLLSLARDRTVEFTEPSERTLWFQGQRDSHGLRERMQRVVEECLDDTFIVFRDSWGATLNLGDIDAESYENQMQESAFVLAPGGEGMGATLRLYEACAFGRIPVVISDARVMWDDLVDTSFMVKLSPSLTDEELAKEFYALYAMSKDEVLERCHRSLLYFEHVVKNYFRDPTGCFIEWMGKRGLL